MPGGPVILDPLTGKVANIENDHKVIAAKTAASKIEVAKGGYTPKTTPTVAETKASLVDVHNPPKTTSFATILEPRTGGTTLQPSGAGILLEPKPGTVPSPTGARGLVLDTGKVHSPTGNLGTVLEPKPGTVPSPTGARGLVLDTGKVHSPTGNLGTVLKPKPGTLPAPGGGTVPDLAIAVDDAGKAGKFASGAGKVLGVAGKILSNPFASKALKVAGPVGAVVGFLADDGNIAKDVTVKVGNVNVHPGTYEYDAAIQKELNAKYGPGWNMTSTPNSAGGTDTVLKRDLFGKDGKVTGHESVNTSTLKMTQTGKGAIALAGTGSAGSAQGNDQLSTQKHVATTAHPTKAPYKDLPALDNLQFNGYDAKGNAMYVDPFGSGRGETVSKDGKLTNYSSMTYNTKTGAVGGQKIQPIVATAGATVTAAKPQDSFSGTASRPDGWKPEDPSHLKDQKTAQTVTIDGKAVHGVTVDIFNDGRQVFHNGSGAVIGYKSTSSGASLPTSPVAGTNTSSALGSNSLNSSKPAGGINRSAGFATDAPGKPTIQASSAATAEHIRSEALNKEYGLGDYAKPASTVSAAATADQIRGEALNKQYGLGDYAKPATTAPVDTQPTPTWETAGVSPNLGGIGGTDLTAHGNALAMRDSKDGSKFIAQMSDGTYESVDKTTGAVAGAGTWGDSHGGNVAVNGVGNPPVDAAAQAAAEATKIADEAAKNAAIANSFSGNINMDQINSDPLIQQAQKEAAAQPTAPATASAPVGSDAVSRYLANQAAAAPPVSTSSVPGQSPQELIAGYNVTPFTLPGNSSTTSVEPPPFEPPASDSTIARHFRAGRDLME